MPHKMDKNKLQQDILELLKSSSIAEHDKQMVQILLPVMDVAVLDGIFKALSDERLKIGQLDEKKKRLELKYSILVDKVSGSTSKGDSSDKS